MTGDEFTRMQAALNILAYAADCDHYCEEDGCTIDTPKCRDRHLHRAARDLAGILEPPHTGFHPKRLQHNDAERIYVEEWQRENTRHYAVNGGYTLIEHSLHPEAEMEKQRAVFGLGGPQPARVTFRDAAVAASVIQWLGTNCGWCFLDRCEQLVKKAKATRAAWERPAQLSDQVGPKTEHRVQAELLASRLYGTAGHERGVGAITAALDAAFAAGKLAGAAEADRE